MPYLELLRVVGDDRAAVHLAARADHGEHVAHGDDLPVRLFETDEEFLPRIVAAVRGHGHRLCIVAHRAAAHRENEIRIAGAGAFAALVQLVAGGIGHDARVLGDGLAALFEYRGHFVVNAVALDRTAAVHQQHVFAVLGQLPFQPVKRVFAEIKFRGIAVSKISEHSYISL